MMTSCPCVYIDSYSDSPEFFKAEIRKARKEHICCECGRKIQPGEEYERVIGRWNGDFCTFKTCSSCLAIRQAFFCEGFAYGEMFSDLRDYLFSIYESNSLWDCIGALPRKAQEDVLDIIQVIWEKSEE